MDKNKIFDDIYRDFFGIDKLEKENLKLRQELDLDNKEQQRSVELNFEKVENQEKAKNRSQELIEGIDDLNIKEDSKNILKKIIDYILRYSEKKETVFIPLNFEIISDDDETIEAIINIIYQIVLELQYLNVTGKIEKSMYNVDNEEKISELYENNKIIIFKDFKALQEKDQNLKNKIIYNIIDNSKNSKKITAFVSKTTEQIDQAFENFIDEKNNIFKFRIESVKPSIQDVYQKIKDMLEINEKMDEEVSIRLLDYISTTYPKSQESYSEYRDKLCQHILLNKKDKIEVDDIPVYEKEKTLEEIFSDLNNLVGLEKVKNVVKDLSSLINLKEKTKGMLDIKKSNLHMVFLGNPGTGKTTVARIIAEILYNLKYIKYNKLIEVSSKDLVAEYVGQTAPKTMSVIEKAMGGVLFIDEAYSLASGGGQGNSYNEEAIATLIQAMENYRDNLVVIFAGYTKEMQDFLDSNSGIVSRIGYTLEFDDYNKNELLKIFENMVKKAGFEITQDALDYVGEVVEENINTKNFGNARFVRNVFEKTVIKHAANTKNLKRKKELITIKKEDISTENLLKM